MSHTRSGYFNQNNKHHSNTKDWVQSNQLLVIFHNKNQSKVGLHVRGDRKSWDYIFLVWRNRTGRTLVTDKFKFLSSFEKISLSKTWKTKQYNKQVTVNSLSEIRTKTGSIINISVIKNATKCRVTFHKLSCNILCAKVRNSICKVEHLKASR